jgi:hypothetical protein
MPNIYVDVIEALANDRIDYQRIVVELAKHNPSLFLRLHKGESKPAKKLLSAKALAEIRNAINAEQRVTAIKALRIATQKTNTPHGLGLKEARDIIMVAAGIERINMVPELQAYVTAIKG